MAPAKKKPTSSGDRSKRAAQSKAVVSGKTPSSRANRQAMSTAKVTSGIKGKAAGSGTARVTSSSVRDAKQQGKANVARAQTRRVAKATSATMAGKLTKARTLRRASSLGRAGVLGAVAAETLKARPTADGTLTGAMKRGDYKPKQGPAVPARMTQAGLDKGSFNSAFKASRGAGKKVFSWRGKKYNTKKAGE
jgi:hypothetical protein